MERNETQQVDITPLKNLLSPEFYKKYQLGQLIVVAVCKHQPPEKILAALKAGYRHFGENTLSGLLRTAAVLSSSQEKAFLHFVGRLQSNKIRKICLGHPFMIHSAAQPTHLEYFQRLSLQGVPLPQLLLQVNVAKNSHQEGLPPDPELIAQLLHRFSTLPIVGLMTLGPNPQRFSQIDQWRDTTGQCFQELAALLKNLVQQGFLSLRHLSMGMSADYDLALSAGATHVRLGTCVFGPRSP